MRAVSGHGLGGWGGDPHPVLGYVVEKAGDEFQENECAKKRKELHGHRD
jgi:hypothetical protein